MCKRRECPNCHSKLLNRCGHTKKNKAGISKQKYKCTECGKQFVDRLEPLNKTEKRIFSLLYNLINLDVDENDTLKTVVAACNKEVKSIGKLDLKITKDDIDLSSLKDIKIAICKKDDDIKIIKKINEIKKCPKAIALDLKDLAYKYKTFFDDPDKSSSDGLS